MKIIINEEKALTKAWIDSCFQPENIPDNSLFLSHFFEKNKQLNIRFYLKFNGEFYYFKKENNALKKMSLKHEFYKTKSINEILAVNITADDMTDFWKKYIDLKAIDAEKQANCYELTEEDHKAYKINKIAVAPVSGATGYTKKSSAIYYDGVQYCIMFYGNNYSEKKQSIAHNLNHFEQIKERHHSLIKEVYNYLIGQLKTNDVFVIPGGGSRIDATFGYSDGFLATITLDMDTPEANVDRKNTIFSMTINKTEGLFKDFKNDKLKIIHT